MKNFLAKTNSKLHVHICVYTRTSLLARPCLLYALNAMASFLRARQRRPLRPSTCWGTPVKLQLRKPLAWPGLGWVDRWNMPGNGCAWLRTGQKGSRIQAGVIAGAAFLTNPTSPTADCRTGRSQWPSSRGWSVRHLQKFGKAAKYMYR